MKNLHKFWIVLLLSLTTGLFMTSCKKPADEPSESERTYENNHEYVDLGLSVKWATMNIGATSVETSGSLFAWGETATKSSYTATNYKYGTFQAIPNMTKYYVSGCSVVSGNVDNKTTLESVDDVATAIWGGRWRMPTQAECQELIDKCTWTFVNESNRKGYLVTGSNGKSIFLPTIDKSNTGSYWTSSLCVDYPNQAWYLGFYYNQGPGKNYNLRWASRNVRAVF